jgi:TatD DNase family protein
MVDVHEDAETTFNMLPSWIEDTKHVYQQYNLGSFEQDCPTLRVAIGCHPHNAKNYTVALENKLEEALHNPRVCAIGEVGLDYHYNLSPVKDQQEAFRKQIRLAHKTGLPLILHMREAHEDGFNILCEEGFPEAGVLLHCFNLSPEVLEPWAEKGCYIAFGGPLTFKSMPEVACSAKVVSSDKLLTETDSPYMTPEPLRGIECGPDYTIFTAAKLLEVRNCTTEDSAKMLLDQLFNNACSLLNREPTQWQRG